MSHPETSESSSAYDHSDLLHRIRTDPDFLARVEARRLRELERNRLHSLRSSKAYEARAENKVKMSARKAVLWAVRRGKLARGPCALLDASCAGDIEAHHWHGYDAEHKLDVQWLCAKHHDEAGAPSQSVEEV